MIWSHTGDKTCRLFYPLLLYWQNSSGTGCHRLPKALPLDDSGL